MILGTASLGSVLPDALTGRRARERVFRQLDALVEAGCVAVDTAASYMIGGTERVLGAWMASRGHRDALFLVGKGCHPVPVLAPRRLTARALDDDLHASLRRLRTDRIDLYLLHRDDPGAPLEPVISALAAHQSAGKIGAWGVSNWTPARIEAAATLARHAGVAPPAASSPQFSLVEWTSPPWRGSESLSGDGGRAARAAHEQLGLPVLAWSPLGRGFFRSGAARDRHYDAPANVARRERAESLAGRKGATAAQIALAYLFHQPFPVFAVVAAGSARHMKQGLEAASITLSPGEVRWLESGEE